MSTTEWRIERGLDHLRRARQEYASGRFAFAAGGVTAESHLRSAMQYYWSAMNWLEDSPDFDTAHAEMHEVGRLVRESFPDGCQPDRRGDGGYVHRCPAFLAHKRFGLSLGGVGNAICSICGGDASECPHVPGRTYAVVASLVDGRCTVCAATDCREHTLGDLYDADARVVVTDLDLREISLVSRPAMPDARITEIPIGVEQLAINAAALLPNGRLSCHRGLNPCDGFDHLPEPN